MLLLVNFCNMSGFDVKSVFSNRSKDKDSISDEVEEQGTYDMI